MKKTKIYRVGAALMAALMVFTGMPQTSLYAWAEEAPVESEMSEDAGTEIGLEQPEQTAAPTEPTAAPAEDASTSPVSEETATDVNPNADPADPPVKEPIHVESITLNHEKLTIQRKESADLKYTLAPNNADVDDDKVVTFSSANPAVATVAPKTGGASVVAVSVGKTTITATTGNGKMASCEVEVTPIPVEKVIIDPSTLNLDMNDTNKSSGTLDVIVSPEDADNTKASLRVNYDDTVIQATYDDTTKEISVTGKKGGSTTLVVVSQDNNKIYGSCEVMVEGETVTLNSLSAKDGYPTNLYEGSNIN